MMITLSIPALEEHLKMLKLDPINQKETDQLIIIFKVEGSDFPIFFRVYESGDLLQLITFIPCNLKTSAVPDLARMLHLINKEVDLPGFGMDEQAKIVYYRVMLPAFRGQIEGELIETIIKSIKNICETFANVIGGVAAGAASFDEVVKKLGQIK